MVSDRKSLLKPVGRALKVINFCSSRFEKFCIRFSHKIARCCIRNMMLLKVASLYCILNGLSSYDNFT